MNNIDKLINIEIKKSLHECYQWQENAFIDADSSWFVPPSCKPFVRFRVEMGLVPQLETIAWFIPLCYNPIIRFTMTPDKDGMKLRYKIKNDIARLGMCCNNSTYYCLLSANLNSMRLFKKHGLI